MVENSPADLVMLAGEVAVTVTREEQHQAVLANYGPDRRVVVELTWCAITTGKYRGQRAIEVRMDGRRVGELTYLMSQRYAPLVAQVNARGGRAGCAALIERDARGLQLTLRLPSETDPPTVWVPAVTTTFAAPPAPMPVGASSGNTFTRHPRAWGIGVVVFAVLLIAGIVGGGDKQQSASPTAGDETTTVDLPATTAVPPTSTTTTTTTTTTTPPPPPPTTTTQVAPPPAPVTEQPAQPQCDPNYSGCVPIASDVDCAGGSGNGPAYAEGPVRVIGSDIYDLDKDHDGTACE
jgi:hypothetical protein